MMQKSPFFILRRRHLLGVLAVLAAAATALTSILIYAPASAPAALQASGRKLPIYCTDRGNKVVSLSFDAAWGDEDTPMLIDILNRYQIKATFFVVGEWVDRCPDAVKALSAAGHEIMNHSDTHPHMPDLSKEQMVAELNACNDKIEAATGMRPILHRPPYGDYSNGLIEAVDSLGMYAVQWDVDSLDWKDPPADAIVKRVTERVQSGSIVLFHNAAVNTPAALPAIIENLQAQGYTFLKVSDMIYRDNYTINHEGRQCACSGETAAAQ